LAKIPSDAAVKVQEIVHEQLNQISAKQQTSFVETHPGKSCLEIQKFTKTKKSAEVSIILFEVLEHFIIDRRFHSAQTRCART
jgi:hypothetical protein